MITPHCEAAIDDALKTGNAILKFISANDVDLTGGHQYGYYLPYSVWEMYTDMPPVRGKNDERNVQVLWQNGETTSSCVHWYGGGKGRREYRLTRFGKDFPYRTFDNLGDLLVIVPERLDFFRCYVLDLDEDIEEIQAALGVETVEEGWGAFRAGHEAPVVETVDVCIERRFREFLAPVTAFPSTLAFSTEARVSLETCIRGFAKLSSDKRLRKLMDGEYRLFRMVERQICQSEIQRLFEDVDDFLNTAQSITNRRKSRAGRSLENHVGYLLRQANIPFDARAKIDGKVEPDILIPGKAAYEDQNYPVEKLCVLGVKTTCKDRWRQVSSEGKRIPKKHILTLQRGISANQLKEMKEANITLVIPEDIRGEYPQDTGITMLNVNEFIASIHAQLDGAPPPAGTLFA